MKRIIDNRPNFRAAGKRAAYEFLENRLKDAQRKLNSNKYELQRIAREQRSLKQDVAAIQQVMWEFRR